MDSFQSDPPEPVPRSNYAPRHNARTSNVRDTFDSIAPFQPLRQDGCGVPRNLTREFHHFSIVPLEEVDDEGCYIGDCDIPKHKLHKTPSQLAMMEGINGAHPKCWMAKDVVIDLIDNPNLDLEKYEEEKRKEEERIKLEELERKAKQEASAKAKGRFNKALMATRMKRILNDNIETMKLEREMGDCKPKRPFEDPLIRLQRRMINENKAHFILLHERLLELWKKTILCDVIIKTCDGLVPCHSAMLSAHCRYWAQFCNETTGDSCRMPHAPVELDFRRRVTGLGIRTVLNYLYSGRIKVNHANCVEVFDVARALKIRDLTHLTERFIKVLLQDHNLWSVVSATRDKSPSSIFDIAWTKLATRFVRLSKTPEFKLLQLEDLIWFLQSDELLVSSEYQVFEAAMIWFAEDRDARKRYFRRLMECVRFAYMTTDELVECMRYDTIFQEDMGIDILCNANLAKVFAHENQQWSGYDLHPARRPDFETKIVAFNNPERHQILQDRAMLKTLDKRVSTNNLDLGKLFDKKYIIPVYHEIRASM